MESIKSVVAGMGFASGFARAQTSANGIRKTGIIRRIHITFGHLLVLFTAIAFHAVPAYSGPVTTLISDGDFIAADYFEFGAGTGTPSSFRETSGGNPGNYQVHGMQVTNAGGGQSHYAGSLNTATSYDPTVSGAIANVTVSYDTAKVIFGDGTDYGIAVQQGGTLYRVDIGSSVGTTEDVWAPNSRTDITTLFNTVNWAGGGAINFGFYSTRTNDGSSSDLNGLTGFDNFMVEIEYASTFGTVDTGFQELSWGGGGSEGGVDFSFSNVDTSGELSVDSFSSWNNFLALANGGAGPTDPTAFLTLAGQTWDIGFTGDFMGLTTLTFGYDESAIPAGTSEDALEIWHWTGTAWESLGGIRNTSLNTITVETSSFSPFLLGTPSASSDPGSSIPEPGTLAIFGFGLIGLVFMRRRRKLN